MKRKILLVLIICVALLFCACSKAEPISTKVGDFDYDQDFTSQIEDQTAAEGNTYLVVYLTPAEGTEVTLDQAREYFLNGTKATISDQTYDISFLVFERIDKKYIRFGLVFEVKDNGYEDAKEQPTVGLTLPQ